MKIKDKILDLRERFKKSMETVSKILGIKIEDISRDQYVRVTVDTNVESRLNKEELNSLGGFKVSKSMIIPKKTKEELDKERLEELKSLYVDYIENIGITPTVSVIRDWGFTSRDISRYFGSQINMYNTISKENSGLFSNLVNDSIFTEKYYNDLKKKLSKTKRFIITTAVSGKEVNKKL